MNINENDKSECEVMLELTSYRIDQHNDLLNIGDEFEIHSHDTFTVQQAVNIFGFGWFHVKLSLFVGLCWMADSMEMTILSIIGPSMQCEWNISKYEKALTTAVVFLGMMLSSTFWTQLSDRYGRKPALTFCGVLLVLYGLLSSVAPSFGWLLILRGLVGFSIGCVPQSVTLYAEFLPTKHKGKCVVLMDCFWAFGACFEVVLALIVYPTLGWRWLLGLSVTPLLLFTILTPFLTESARFHALNTRGERAIQVLEQIAKDNKRHMLTGRLVSDEEGNSSAHIGALFNSGLKRTTLLLWFIWMACAFSYYGLVLISTELLAIRKDKIHEKDCTTFDTTDFMDLLWITFSEFPGIFGTIAAIKRYGKKKTMVVQFLIFAGCVLLLAFNKRRGYNITILFVARGVISGLFQAAYIYTPEVYPANLRSVGVGGCSALARLGAMATPFLAQVFLQSSTFQVLAIYSAVGLLSAIACALLPHTTPNNTIFETIAKLENKIDKAAIEMKFLKEIMCKQTVLLETISKSLAVAKIDLEIFPITSVQEFKSTEELIITKSEDEVISFIKQKFGRGDIRRILPQLFDENFLLKVNWDGTKHKEAVNKYKLFNHCFFEAVNERYPSFFAYEAAMKDAFRKCKANFYRKTYTKKTSQKV